MYLINTTDSDITLKENGNSHVFPGNPRLKDDAEEVVDVVVEVGNPNVARHFIDLTYVAPERWGKPSSNKVVAYSPTKDRKFRVATSIYAAAKPAEQKQARINWITDPKNYKQPGPDTQRLERSRLEMIATLPHSILLEEALKRKLIKSKKANPTRQALVDILAATDYAPPALAVSHDNPITSSVAKEKGLQLPSDAAFEEALKE